MSASVGLTPAAVGECTVARSHNQYDAAGGLGQNRGLCPSCRGARGRTVADYLDGGSPDYRYESCEDCESFEADAVEDERLEAMLSQEEGYP